jgi:hypothetical protein
MRIQVGPSVAGQRLTLLRARTAISPIIAAAAAVYG